MLKLQKEPTSIISYPTNFSGVINVFWNDTFMGENNSCLAKLKLAEQNLIGAWFPYDKRLYDNAERTNEI